MLALSDALALVLLEKKGFTKADYAKFHHGGYLGKKARREAQNESGSLRSSEFGVSSISSELRVRGSESKKKGADELRTVPTANPNCPTPNYFSRP